MGTAPLVETCSCCGSFDSTAISIQKNHVLEEASSIQKAWKPLPLWTLYLILKEMRECTLAAFPLSFLQCYMYMFIQISFIEKESPEEILLIYYAKKFNRKGVFLSSRNVHYPHSIAHTRYTCLIKPLAQQEKSLWITNCIEFNQQGKSTSGVLVWVSWSKAAFCFHQIFLELMS